MAVTQSDPGSVVSIGLQWQRTDLQPKQSYLFWTSGHGLFVFRMIWSTPLCFHMSRESSWRWILKYVWRSLSWFLIWPRRALQIISSSSLMFSRRLLAYLFEFELAVVCHFVGRMINYLYSPKIREEMLCSRLKCPKPLCGNDYVSCLLVDCTYMKQYLGF